MFCSKSALLLRVGVAAKPYARAIPYTLLLDYLSEADKALFLWFNGLHLPWLDPIMMQASDPLFWTPLYLWWIYLIVVQNTHNRWQTAYVWIGLVLVVTLTDQLSATVMKPFFARFRPSHNPALAGLVHIVDGYRGGLYGFPSSHASNSFGVALLLSAILKKNTAAIVSLITWAVLFSYTRLYLGVHYPGDLLGGSVLGLVCGSVVILLIHRARPRLFDG